MAFVNELTMRCFKQIQFKNVGLCFGCQLKINSALESSDFRIGFVKYTEMNQKLKKKT